MTPRGDETPGSGPHDVQVEVRVLPHGRGLPLPAYQTPGSAGMDLVAAVEAPAVLQPGERMAVPTGLSLAVPAGFEAQVRPRSGLALRCGLTLANSPGTIDADYRGEVKVLVVNIGHEPVRIARGMRIAQIVVAPVARARLAVVPELAGTGRGEGGFGSTGA